MGAARNSTATRAFDKPGNAISWFQGHGGCGGDVTFSQVCTSSSQCNSPPGVGTNVPGKCWRDVESPSVSGVCFYNSPRQILLPTGATNGWIVDYSWSNVRWGEGIYATWAHAGGDGSINAAFIINSCGSRPGMSVWELGNAFAGISTIALLQPMDPRADIADDSGRADAVTAAYRANPNASIAHSWVVSQLSTAYSYAGGNCKWGGGYRGFFGCGAYVTVSAGNSYSDVVWRAQQESWLEIRDEANDSLGSAYLDTETLSNYNDLAHPPII